jgi:hypothetical protein
MEDTMSVQDAHTTTLQFLFSQRLELFNVRRQHEWQVLIGVVVALGAVDFALMQKDVRFGSIQLVWVGTLCLLFAAVYMYEFGVQERNRIDRLALDELNHLLCDSLELPASSEGKLQCIRLLIDGETLECGPREKEDDILGGCYLWAFWNQMLVLLVACVLSAGVPFLSPAATGAATATDVSRIPVASTILPLTMGGVTLLVLTGWTLWRRSITRMKRTPGEPATDVAIPSPKPRSVR